MGRGLLASLLARTSEGSVELQRENVSGQELQQEQERPQAATPRAGFQTPGYSQIKMLCDPVRDGGSEEGSSLQPWQIYSGLFLGFWAFSAFFNHFLATALLCLVFGAAGDQLTRYMYTLGSSMAGGGKSGEVVTLLDMAREEVSP